MRFMCCMFMALLGHAAYAQPDATLNGSNTLRFEHYRAAGDMNAAPYSSLGWQNFDEVNLNGQYRASPFDQWRMQFAGVMSRSAYRSQSTGGTMERFALVRENGESSVPYRLEAGDLLGFYSMRTLQQSVKGGQFELQGGSGSVRQSLVVTSGALGKPWRGFNSTPADNILGASWVIEHATFGHLSANLVNSRRDANLTTGALNRTQTVASLAAGNTYKHAMGQTTLEAEIAHMSGDHDGIAGAVSGQSRQGGALYGQVSGRNTSGAMDYRLRFERNGQDFRPRAAVVAADREAREAHLGYRMKDGMQVRGRLQQFVDSRGTVNPSTTQVAGVNLSGALLPFLAPKLSGNVDIFNQNVFNRALTSNATVQAMTLSLNHPLAGGMNGRVSASFNDTNNRVAGGFVSISKTLGADLDMPVKAWGFTGNLSFGLQYRRAMPNSSGQEAWAPRLATQLVRGPHSLSLDWSSQRQNMLAPGAVDVISSTPNLSYRYQTGQHVLGLEYNYNLRKPQPGLATEGERVSAFWTFNFDQPARVSTVVQGAHAAPIPTPAVRATQVPGFFSLKPGMTLTDAKNLLGEQGIRTSVDLEGLKVFEATALPQLSQRQRIGLAHEAGDVDTLALVLDVDNPADGIGLIRQYEEVRRVFLDSLGNPSEFLDRGDVVPNVADAIRAGTFIRLTEWRVAGGTVRMGLPQRLDGQVRIEIQYTRLPLTSQTRWSLEALR